MKRISLTLAAVLLAVSAGRSGAQQAPDTTAVASQGGKMAQPDSTLEARTSAVAVELRCPVCRGESIQESPAELAQQMRGLIRDQLRAGKSPDEVKAYFVSKYGESILLQPRATGFNLVVFVLPIVAVLGGLAVVIVAMRRWTKPSEQPPAV